MNSGAFRLILFLNLMVIAGIYLLIRPDSAGYNVIFWAFATFIHIGANLVLAAFTGAIRALGRGNNVMPGVPQAFLICAGLVLLISFPLCFALNAISH